MILRAVMLLMCSTLFAQDFIEGKHYHKIAHIKPQQQTEIHYFFSFYCPSCAKMAETVDKYLQEQNGSQVYRHPLVRDESGIRLLRAYQILLEKEQGHTYKKILYQFSPQKKITEKDLLDAFKKSGHGDFSSWWAQQESPELEAQLKTQLQSHGALAQEYRLKAIPTVVVVGPKGAYYLQPVKPVTLDNFTDCLDYIVKMGNTR